jgi:3'-phosphoadenosine 5'-phosphosulfate (PAPS) 3'-phosphatase
MSDPVSHPMQDSPYAAEVAVMIAAMLEASETVRDLYDRAAAATYEKQDGSPVTDADLASDRIIRAVLAERFPDDAILTEEGADDPSRLASARCWIVDPIDGTQQFVDRTGDFDVLMALAVDGRPVIAGSIQPPTGVICLAAEGAGAWIEDGSGWRRVQFDVDGRAPVVATSHWFGAPENLSLVERIGAGIGGEMAPTTDIGLTPRQFLDGDAIDILLGFRLEAGQFMAHEWDAATADLFLHEAGGAMTDLHGRTPLYNQPDPHLGRGLVVAVTRDLHAIALRETRRVLESAGLGEAGR